MKNVPLDFALNYIALGRKVFPAYEINSNGVCCCPQGKNCDAPGKHPRIKNGCKMATDNKNQVEQWWKTWPKANIGIATGKISDLVVLDIDKDKGGFASLKTLKAQHGEFPVTTLIQSGGGGLHYFFKSPKAVVKNRVGLLPGIDFRGDGGYVISAPSNHKSGGTYEVINLAPPALLPDFLLELVTGGGPSALKGENKNGNHHEKLKVGEDIYEGARDDKLFRFGCSLRWHGFKDDDIYATLVTYDQKHCKPPLGNTSIEKIMGSILTYEKSLNHPTPLPNGTKMAPKLNSNLIPKPLAEWIIDVAETMNRPLEMITVPALAGFSGLIGRRAVIHPKKYDSRFEVAANVWGAIIAEPGQMKTPAINEGLSPIRAIENDLAEKFNAEFKEHQNKELFFDIQIEELEKQLREKIKKGDPSVDEIKEKMIPLCHEKKNTPVKQRLTYNESTPQALIELLRENPNGLTLTKDELTGFLYGLDQKGRETERPFYLEAWNGNSAYHGRTISRGTAEIDCVCISMIGGIQPHRLKEYFSKVMNALTADDGFLSRFQLMVAPEFNGPYKHIDRPQNEKAKTSVLNCFRNLHGKRAEELFLPLQKNIRGSSIFHFDSKAQTTFDKWFTDLQNRLATGGFDSPAFEAHLSKYRSLMPKLALLFHLLDLGAGSTKSLEVSFEATELSIQWCSYLLEHAEKVYAETSHPSLAAARNLLERIKNGDVSDGDPIRELYRKGWKTLDKIDKFRKALDFLVEYGWVSVETIPSSKTNGAPSEIIRFHDDLVTLIASTKFSRFPIVSSVSPKLRPEDLIGETI